MATVKFSAFISDVRGRLDDYVFSFNRGTHYKKAHNPNPTQPNTPRQLQIQKIIGEISQVWDTVPQVSKNLWQGFAVMLPKRMSAANAFLMLNSRLLMASHADLGCIYNPPSIPATPKFPSGFCVFSMSPTLVCLSWSYPLLTSTYISCFFRLHCSFCRHFPTYGDCNTVGYRPSRRFITTVRSDQSYALHTHSWPVGSRLYYKLRSIDKYGRISPYTHQIMIYAG